MDTLKPRSSSSLPNSYRLVKPRPRKAPLSMYSSPITLPRNYFHPIETYCSPSRSSVCSSYQQSYNPHYQTYNALWDPQNASSIAYTRSELSQLHANAICARDPNYNSLPNRKFESGYRGFCDDEPIYCEANVNSVKMPQKFGASYQIKPVNFNCRPNVIVEENYGEF